jgi:ankyrin repeat protein
VTEILIKAGVDMNGRDEDGMTPLHWGARNGHEEVVEKLLEGGLAGSDG